MIRPSDSSIQRGFYRSVDETVEAMNSPRYARVMRPVISQWAELLRDAMGPLGVPTSCINGSVWFTCDERHTPLQGQLFSDETGETPFGGVAAHSLRRWSSDHQLRLIHVEYCCARSGRLSPAGRTGRPMQWHSIFFFRGTIRMERTFTICRRWRLMDPYCLIRTQRHGQDMRHGTSGPTPRSVGKVSAWARVFG